MKRRWGLWLIALNLCGLIVLAFMWPHLMVAPGPLMPAHANITSNCFACHAPFEGVSADRCIACHKLSDIGIRTTKGVAVPKGRDAIAFHQSLIEPNCMACHSDHVGPKLVKTTKQSFAHALLRPEIRNKCVQCHRVFPVSTNGTDLML